MKKTVIFPLVLFIAANAVIAPCAQAIEWKEVKKIGHLGLKCLAVSVLICTTPFYCKMAKDNLIAYKYAPQGKGLDYFLEFAVYTIAAIGSIYAAGFIGASGISDAREL